ncbi:signal recognition particle-docking protein FtsY [Candidatus Dependentiae bacterium]|nr:signal recognition particle-docking protein FtsY [Candidatus Dependentiae bacterium]
MISFLKNKLKKIYENLTSSISAIFAKPKIDETSLQELEKILIKSDAGFKTTKNILEKLREQFKNNPDLTGQDLKNELKTILNETLSSSKNLHILDSKIYLLVGINGSGKTTFAAKLAYKFIREGKRVLLVAGDTFRAAATEQLKNWAHKINVDIFIGKPDQDPASVIFAACEKFKTEQYDILIIDTAGRLQTKINLMKELEKINNVISKQLPENKISTLLVLDSMLGQNSFEQARIFNEATKLSGIVLTKMDGTAKGGIVFGISKELNIPVAFITFGEGIEDWTEFDATKYVDEILQ